MSALLRRFGGRKSPTAEEIVSNASESLTAFVEATAAKQGEGGKESNEEEEEEDDMKKLENQLKEQKVRGVSVCLCWGWAGRD